MKRLKYDAFIAHASEDKKGLANPLASKLREEGLNIWIDDFELNPGDSLYDMISKGLKESKYAICIFSPAFFKKKWPQYELKGTVQLLLSDRIKFLPIWLNIAHDEIINYSPPLADFVAIKSNGKNVEDVFLKCLKMIKPKIHRKLLRKMAFDYVAKTTREQKAKLSDLKQAEIKHKNLPNSAISRSNLICEVFGDLGLEFMKVEEFIENLKRDTHPEDELKIWEILAVEYLKVRNKYNLTLNQKKEIFKILLGKSSGMDLTESVEGKKLPEEISVKMISNKRVEDALKMLNK